jgi:uncharacterized protein (TIGR03503 family)
MVIRSTLRSRHLRSLLGRLLCTLLALLWVVHALSVPSRAENNERKTSHSDEKSSHRSKTRHKERFDKVEPEPAIGSDSHYGESQFNAEAAQAGKVDAVLVLDSSRSMTRTDPDRLRDEAAKLFLRFLGTGDRVAIVQFDREVKTISPLAEVNAASLANLDKAIESVPTEGGFTDLEAAIEEAMKILVLNARNDAQRTVILLSDGKMDPHPSRGTAEELTEKVRQIDLPQYHEKNIKLYAVAFSDEADKKLLSSFATDTGGISWFAPDPTTIHKKFSELFLTLKRPQVVALEGSGFEIDSSVREATFYITRKDDTQKIGLTDPRGTEINTLNIPAGIKWFSGNNFEVITISNPFPGRWAVTGVEDTEGFATLLSDIKLQVRWPQSSFKLGDSVAVYARLTNSGKEVEKNGLDEITFYTYKILDDDSGATWLTGALNDKGEDGDAKANDGIYSTTLKLDKEGDYQAWFAVTSPTFTRQQRVPFTVSSGIVTLKVVPPDEFTGAKETVQAVLSKDPHEFKSLKVQLIAKRENEDKPVGLTLKPRNDAPKIYDIPLERLKAGKYELSVRVTGTDEKRKKVSASSETITYTIAAKEGENTSDEEVDELAEESAPSAGHGELITGILCLLAALGWVSGLVFFGLKKISANKSQVEERAPFQIPEELAKRIEIVKSTASETRRKASTDEKELFALVADVFKNEAEAAPAQSEAAAEAQEEQS